MPETREEAVRREFEKWARKETGYPFPLPLSELGGEYKYSDTRFAWVTWQASREAALREAVAAVASKAALWEKETKNYVGMLHETCGMRARCLRDAEKAILALIPVAGKEEKA